MKKTINVALSLFLLVSIMLLSSCGWIITGPDRGFPDGYTGGLGITYGSTTEHYWVESYEEAMAAIELLKSHGSTFDETVIFSYEGELFDTKYCFSFRDDRDFCKYGDNPFDRWAEDVLVTSYGFLEDVSIDTLMVSYISDYDVVYLTAEYDFEDKLTTNDMHSGTFDFSRSLNSFGFLLYNEKNVASISRTKGGEERELTEEMAKAIYKSADFVGLSLLNDDTLIGIIPINAPIKGYIIYIDPDGEELVKNCGLMKTRYCTVIWNQ